MIRKSQPFIVELFTSILLMAVSLSPVLVTPVQLTSGSLQPATWQEAQPLAAGRIKTSSTLIGKNGTVRIQSPEGNWSSPAGWTVQQANWTDLNHDGDPEVTLLVKRPFSPWPVDRVLPHGGFINSHQDADGFSSHIILIGWKGDHWGELWAGSALARPVRSFKACDVNNDGRQEMMVLEGDYADRDPSTASSLAIWEWNSFGFDLVSRLQRTVSQAIPVLTDENQSLILVQ